MRHRVLSYIILLVFPSWEKKSLSISNLKASFGSCLVSLSFEIDSPSMKCYKIIYCKNVSVQKEFLIRRNQVEGYLGSLWEEG